MQFIVNAKDFVEKIYFYNIINVIEKMIKNIVFISNKE